MELHRSAKTVFGLVYVINSEYEPFRLPWELTREANNCMALILTERLNLYKKRFTDKKWLLLIAILFC